MSEEATKLWRSSVILEAESSLASHKCSITSADNLFLQVSIVSHSASKPVKIIQPPSAYPPLFTQDKSGDNHAKGRIKYEMQAFVRGFNNRMRIIKNKTEIVIRETAPISNDKK